jgi:hypothetical protein
MQSRLRRRLLPGKQGSRGAVWHPGLATETQVVALTVQTINMHLAPARGTEVGTGLAPALSPALSLSRLASKRTSGSGPVPASPSDQQGLLKMHRVCSTSGPCWPSYPHNGHTHSVTTEEGRLRPWCPRGCGFDRYCHIQRMHAHEAASTTGRGEGESTTLMARTQNPSFVGCTRTWGTHNRTDNAGAWAAPCTSRVAPAEGAQSDFCSAETLQWICRQVGEGKVVPHAPTQVGRGGGGGGGGPAGARGGGGEAKKAAVGTPPPPITEPKSVHACNVCVCTCMSD